MRTTGIAAVGAAAQRGQRGSHGERQCVDRHRALLHHAHGAVGGQRRGRIIRDLLIGRQPRGVLDAPLGLDLERRAHAELQMQIFQLPSARTRINAHSRGGR